MSKNVHVVPHIHWDREWYFTTEESRILLVNNMEEVMEMLETNENYPYYVLDGQTAVLEDYFAVKPENYERVKKLVEAGKLIVGPWYTQTDEMVVGGESIVRNLLYGLKDSKKLGDPMMIGYLPDSFGQSEKLPQILNGFDIDRCMFWRGSSERHGTNKNNFYWESDSEGKVLVHLMPLGYAIGKYLPEEKVALEKRMSKYMPVLEKGAVNNEILLPNGHDQMPIQKNIFEVMKTLKEIYPDKEFFLSKYENIFDELEKVPNLDTIKGELLDGKYMRVHRSIFSTRADLKTWNTRIENKITNILEPLASLAYSLGVSYEEGLIEAIWKEIMKNHAHDSIGCCCSDKVHKDIANRFFVAEDKTDELIRFYKRKIVDAMSCDVALDKLTVFNLLPYEREEVVKCEIITKMKNFSLKDENGNDASFNVIEKEVIDAGLIDRQIVHYGDYDPFVKYTILLNDKVPSMGYKTYLIQEIEGEISKETPTTGNVLENAFYHITVEKNGTLTICDKEINKTYKNVLLVEDGSDDGDEYDFSPLEDDFVLTSENGKAEFSVKNYKFEDVAEINVKMEIPKDLDSRKAKICDSVTELKFTVGLKKDSKIISVGIDVNNNSCDHRMRVLVPNLVGSDKSKSDNQFGEIKRLVVDEAMAVWEKEGWDERPDSIYPMLSYAAIDNKEGLGVLTNSVREFEIIGEKFDTVAVTIFRSVGVLGKENLFRRPGRPSGIKMETPDAQLLGKQHYEIAIVKNEENLAKLAKEFTTPFVTYNKMPYNAMKLNQPNFEAPYNYSLVEVDNKEFVITAFKKADSKEGFIIRGFQTVENSIEAAITGKSSITEVKLNECEINKCDGKVTIPKNVVKSYLIK